MGSVYMEISVKDLVRDVEGRSIGNGSKDFALVRRNSRS